jgi:hypothetical protein
MKSFVETRTDELEENATGRNGEQDISGTRYAGRVAPVLSERYETVTINNEKCERRKYRYLFKTLHEGYSG